MKEQIEVIEIWAETEEDGHAISWPSGKHLKLVAYIANGHPMKLDEGFVMQRRHIPKEEYEEMKKSNPMNHT